MKRILQTNANTWHHELLLVQGGSEASETADCIDYQDVLFIVNSSFQLQKNVFFLCRGVAVTADFVQSKAETSVKHVCQIN